MTFPFTMPSFTRDIVDGFKFEMCAGKESQRLAIAKHDPNKMREW
jgi:hypothetical protein